MALIDLLIVVVVAVFIITRFTKFKLPTDERPKDERAGDWRNLLNRTQQPRSDRPVGERAKPARERVVDTTARRVVKPAPKKVDLTGLDGLGQIKALDPAFDDARFVDGAKAAYRYFYDRWNASDEGGLADLCAPQLLNQLVLQLEAYDNRGEQPHVEIKEPVEASIAGARVNGRTAVIEVEFMVYQAVDGGPMHLVRSRWTLARPIGSEDPNWELQQVLELGGQA